MEYFKYRSNFSNYVINEEENLAKVYQGEAIPIENRVNLGYGDDPEKYLQSGERDTTRMLDILGKNNVALEPGSSILDFGCGSARMLRWVQKLAPDCEYQGSAVQLRVRRKT